MLASILKSEQAIQMSISIVRAFIEMKKQLTHYAALAQKIHELEEQTNTQFLEVYEALENLINDTSQLKHQEKQRSSWDHRKKIGFEINK